MGKKPVLKKSVTGIRIFSYSVFTFVIIAGLTLAVNITFFILLALQYHQVMPKYIKGEEVIEELTLTQDGYRLSDRMGSQLDEKGQWAMLLDETGRVVWSHGRPEEIGDSYTVSDIARMSRWYLEDYPVYMRVWEDSVMVVAIPRNSMWKYNLEFPISWIEYFKRIWYWMLLFDFLWILTLAVVFTRRWSKSREQARIEWIAGISHDTRTPLAVALGYADALESGGRLSGEERQKAAVIRHQCMVMKELIEDLNLTSRLEYSMQALRMEEVHPAAVLREVAAAFLDDAGEGTLEIEMDLDRQAEGIVLMADRQLLVRALRNLFHNSLRHSEQTDTTVIRLGLREEKRFCRILFADNGIGYSDEMLRQLNGRKSRQPTPKYTGLGIVCRIVQARGGQTVFGNGAQGGSFCEMRFRKRRKTVFCRDRDNTSLQHYTID